MPFSFSSKRTFRLAPKFSCSSKSGRIRSHIRSEVLTGNCSVDHSPPSRFLPSTMAHAEDKFPLGYLLSNHLMGLASPLNLISPLLSNISSKHGLNSYDSIIGLFLAWPKGVSRKISISLVLLMLRYSVMTDRGTCRHLYKT